jgi:ribosomal protein L37AE/L43A
MKYTKICPYCKSKLNYVHSDDEFAHGYWECFECGYMSDYDYDHAFVDDYDYKKDLEEYYESQTHK